MTDENRMIIVLIATLIFSIIIIIVERLRRIKTEYKLEYIENEYKLHIKKHNEECYIWIEHAIEYKPYEIHRDFKTQTT